MTNRRLAPPRRLSPILGLLVAGLLAANTTAAEQDTAPVTVLRAERVFDGLSDRWIANGTVIVQADRILAVGPAATTRVPAGTTISETIDLGDATLLPGFLDAHVHLTGEMSDDWASAAIASMRRHPTEDAIRAVEYARRTLYAGFTTVRSAGAGEFIDSSLRNAGADGTIVAPRLLAANSALGARGGHCDSTGFPHEFFGDEPGVAQGIASGADAFRDAVRFQIKYGADVIKVCATGGVLSLAGAVDAPQVTQAEMDAIVDETHRLGKKVLVHAHGAEGAKVAIRAGADSVEHGSFLDDEALRLMKERGTYFVPTLLAGEYVAGRKAKRQLPPEIAIKARQAMAERSTTFRRALAAGVKIAFGTDSGVSPHGTNAEEFALLVEHGMTPAAALRSATAVASELFGVSADRGTLAAGKLADIVAVPGDPLVDISATERVHFVMLGGRIIRQP